MMKALLRCGVLFAVLLGTARAAGPYLLENLRGGDTPVLSRPGAYDYVPSILDIGGTLHMWWCGSTAGDGILHAQSENGPAGPWHSFDSTVPNSVDVTFRPRAQEPGFNPNDNDFFDTLHVCDPSVIRVGGTFYLYYGGDTLHNTIGQNTVEKTCACDGIAVCGQNQCDGTTRIGVAMSTNGGRSWQRLNDGLPIVQPAWARPGAKVEATNPSPYGSGQPSVTYVDDRFYLIYTDSTGAATNPVSGAGQFVLRAGDPTFQLDLEELACTQRNAQGACLATAFVPFSPSIHTRYSLVEGFSVDWQYSDDLNAFVVANHRNEGEIEILLLSKNDLRGENPLAMLTLPGNWRDGPGLVSTPDRHAIRGAAAQTLKIDLLRAVGAPDPNAWDLAWRGADLKW